MSELLGYAKAMRALGNALERNTPTPGGPSHTVLSVAAKALMEAATDLEAQAKATTTGRTGTDWHPLGGEPRKVGK